MHNSVTHLSKGGNTNFENFKKGGDMKKKLGWRKPGEEKDFQNERGKPTFQVEFRDKKGQKWGLSETI